MDSDDKKISQLSTAVPVSTDIMPYVSLPGSSPVTKNTLYDNGGWIGGIGTWSYSSADSPTFVISINTDVTGIIGVGMRIKLTQTTVKYFIVTAVGVYSGGATLVTVYGGTDYTLANAAITLPYYSHAKAPLGFPMSRSKWTVTLSDTNTQSQASPTASTWYNLGSLSITIPIGEWLMQTKGRVDAAHAGVTNLGVRTTLSTANNSESNVESTTNATISATSTTNTLNGCFFSHTFLLSLTSKTVHYLNALTGTASCTSITFQGTLTATVVKAVCAYL